MIAIAVSIGFLCVGLSLGFNAWRLALGPSPADRVLALDTMTINVISLIVLYGIATQTAILFEAAMLFAMVGFVSSVALCKFLLRGDVIE